MSSSSSNKGQQIMSSPTSKPKIYSRSWNELRHLESVWNNAANQLHQLNVNNDRLIASKQQMMASNAPSYSSLMQNERMAEEVLVERLKESITEFMNRPGRHYSYDTSMRWSLEHCDQIKYSVVISVKKPSDSI
ncbi:unnamed protein product [Rotaria magnacalcarata]|uniref:Uncharacterized protein n=1 Tax=Rotaria magnacalcarata TaxID=392030 RepID=A0A816U535_9BILA|nr:unnamed protein product [Rotaria magnacalcarata]CAF3865824.1 unnamed protein product [Rotaria magnacalcarata]